MRIAAWMVACVLVASAAVAQDLIEWSPQRKLVRADFKGRVPPAASMGSLSWISIDASWQCDASGRLVTSARAMFDPARSWWRLGPSVSLLQHEQLHFDLVEIAVRKIRRRLGDFEHACARRGGTAEVGEVIAQMDRVLQAEQREYDRATSHGTNAEAQQRWEARVLSDLRRARP